MPVPSVGRVQLDHIVDLAQQRTALLAVRMSQPDNRQLLPGRDDDVLTHVADGGEYPHFSQARKLTQRESEKGKCRRYRTEN